jgi:beta-glucosidase
LAIATKIGLPARPEEPACVEAARRFTVDPDWTGNHEIFLNNTWWTDPVILGRYPDILTRELPALADAFAADLAEINQPVDFFGFNYYFGTVIEADTVAPWRRVAPSPGEPRTMFGWPVHPEGMYWASRFFHERYMLPIHVLENGLSSADWVALDGGVHDPARVDFLHRYLLAFRRAGEEGIPIRSYFHWSLLDNFEWAQGYRERFGLIHVSYESQKRVLKDSAVWYAGVIASQGRSLG